MAASGDTPMRYSSSPELSDPPSGLSETNSPAGYSNNRPRPGGELDEIVVDHSTFRFDLSGQPLLTKGGQPRKKPGPKPGTKLKRHTNPDESSADGTKVRKPRKPRDPNAPPIQRKRKMAGDDSMESEPQSRSVSVGAPSAAAVGASAQRKVTEIATTSGRLEPILSSQPAAPKREGPSQPRSMQSILNADPEPQPQPSAPSRSSGTNYDPIRTSNYDPVRGTMVTNYSNPLGSPRGSTTNVINRASASPSIASLVDPPVQNIISPASSHATFAPSTTQQQPSRASENKSVPESPNPFKVPPPAPKPAVIIEAKKPAAPPPLTEKMRIEIRPQSITTIVAASKRTPPKNQSTASSSPRAGAQKDSLAPMPGTSDRSILDFGKAEPGSELNAPSIVLHVPLNGETNKYVNFMRMAEERYGWDALHPRQAEHRARKARIAAASAALAQNDSNREADEMSVDESDNEDSNVEMGGTSGPDKPDEKKKKKRHFKEDEYDKDDGFVDDSELLWEEQAAASRDGFFVYSGPLVPEVEKPESRADLPKRGRGSRGGRGGRGTAGTTRGSRGGGPGSRGGVARKPRMTKADKAQMDREKAEREAILKSTATPVTYNVLHPGSPQFAGL